MIERLRIRVPAGAVGEFSSLGLTFCADSYSVSEKERNKQTNKEKPVILPKVQVAGYS